MPTELTPEDLFDFQSWATRPILAAVEIVKPDRTRTTLVLRQPNIEDQEAAIGVAAAEPHSWRRAVVTNEVLVSRCLVGAFAGEMAAVELESVPITDGFATHDKVRKLREQIREVEWAKVEVALTEVSKASVEPDPTSSPAS